MVNNVQELKSMAKLIRKDIVSMLTESASGHPGGSLSAADIVTTLFFKEMNIDANNPKNPDRDRFVLSKGHAAPVLYSALARKGFFPVEELTTLRKFGSRLPLWILRRVYKMEDKIIVCKDCGKEFTFTVGEQEFYKEKGFENDPVRCPDCRRARKAQKMNRERK